MDKTGMLISQLDITAGVVAGIMVTALALLFSRTKVGRGLRGVAVHRGIAHIDAKVVDVSLTEDASVGAVRAEEEARGAGRV